MHWEWQFTAPPELLDAGPGDAPKGALPNLGASVNAFFCGESHSQGVKIHEDLLKMHGFQCIEGGSVPPPLSWRTFGCAMRQKTCRDMECWYVMVEHSLVVASIFSFRTIGQWEHWD